MMRITVLGYLFAVLCGLAALLSSSNSPLVEAVCSTSRVRKNYDSLTLAERQLYRNALQISMDKGYYIKFLEMHTEWMSEMEAHQVCMFTYWHRYFLLGFENMLRSLGPAYECITVPYWDEMQHNAKAMTGACTSLASCALIVRDMGGLSTGSGNGLTVNGAWVPGDSCVGVPPMNHFCESSSKTGSACARCIPRSNLNVKTFPSATNFASVYRQLFTSGAFVATGKSIEGGLHNAIHSTMGGAMGTLQSPSDPLFFSHHAYVDLLLTVYLRCRVGLGKLTDEQKKNNQYAFVQCPHREDSGVFTSDSTVTMRDGELGINPKQVNQPDQDLYPFFVDLPSKYYQLSDITQLGANRYTYQVGGLVGQMASRCDAATGTRRRLKQRRRAPRHLECKSDVAEDAQIGTTNETTTAAPTVPDLPADLPVDHAYDNDPHAAKVTAWVDDVRKQLAVAVANKTNQSTPLDDTKAATQLEKMVCMFYDQCRGGVQDYSDEFKAAFKVSEPPPCKRIVDELKSNVTAACDQIQLPDWKQVMEKYFPCEVAPPSSYDSAADDGSDLSA